MLVSRKYAKIAALLFTLFLFTVSFHLQASCSGRCHKKKHSPEYDYIVVGVGTAGSIVARRLSDDFSNSVLGLHEGENLTRDPLIRLARNLPITALLAPTFSIATSKTTEFYSPGFSTPQPQLNGNQIPWVIARPLGGASSVNGSAIFRGTDQNFAQWEALLGPNWSVSLITDIYKNLETYYGETTNPAVRGFNGPVDVLQNPKPSKISQKFTEALIEATGFPFVLDYNDPNTPIGNSSQLQISQTPNQKLRVSSATAFLDGVINQNGRGLNGRKLRIRFNTPVLKVIFEGKKAVGVEYLSPCCSTTVCKAFARKGIVICSGLRSSILLMHSGIGPKKLLRKFDIPVVFDNPNVGRNFCDQSSVLLLFAVNPADFSGVKPNILFQMTSILPKVGGDPLRRRLRLTITANVPGEAAGFFDIVVPKSRGKIIINSSDPLANPVIDYGALTNPQDLQLLLAGFRTYIKNLTVELRKVDPAYKLISPDPAILEDPILLTEFIRNNLASPFSFQAHCRMAPLNKKGVVDNRGRVHGVDNLFVADASVFPFPIDGTPYVVTQMVGENISRLILNE